MTRDGGTMEELWIAHPEVQGSNLANGRKKGLFISVYEPFQQKKLFVKTSIKDKCFKHFRAVI